MYLDATGAMTKGFLAFKYYGDEAECPYAEGTEFHAAWVLGWYIGMISQDRETVVH